MRTSRLALAVSLPVAVPLVVACGTTAPSAGAAYGTSTPTAAAAASSSPSVSASAGRSGAPMIPAKTVLTVEKTKIGYVLATATGMTLYWYSRDVKGSGKPACAGACLTSWPVLTGTPIAAAGVTLAGRLGTITRTDGLVQATYNGYPLYTYVADTAAGQTSGNGAGGGWHVITGTTLSSSPAAAAAASARDRHADGGTATAPSASASATTTGY